MLAGTRPMLAPNLENGEARTIPARPRNRGSNPEPPESRLSLVSERHGLFRQVDAGSAAHQ